MCFSKGASKQPPRPVHPEFLDEGLAFGGQALAFAMWTTGFSVRSWSNPCKRSEGDGRKLDQFMADVCPDEMTC